MHRLLVSLLSLLVILTSAGSAGAQFSLGGGKAPMTQATLQAEVKSIAAGEPFNVALQLKHPAGWHSYYQNSGGVELPPSIKWTMPTGFSASSVQFPVPDVKDGYFGKSFVHSGEPVFLVEITPSASLSAGESVEITANASWQICKESCINESKSFTLTLPVAAAPELDPTSAALFSAARQAMPRLLPSTAAAASVANDEVILRVSPESPLQAPPTDFVPDQSFLQPASAGGNIVADEGSWVVTLKKKTLDSLDQPIPFGDTVSGILVGPEAVKIPQTSFSSPQTTSASLPLSKLFPILGGMLLGGLILNLMPCVFPVIGLKIMGFVRQAGEDRKKIALHGVAFAVGVFASFAVLSGLLFVLKLSWGYQLQNPWVVLSLLLLMFVLALNMAGVFEIGTSATSVGGSLQSKQGLSGSFFSGVLATVVATPCSAPFLGAAIGAAIALPAVQFFTAFAAMATGLALPYLILSFFPKLISYLPKPGAWMESFKQGMAFLLFATAGWLLWVYGALIDFDALLNPIFGLCAIAAAAWVYGRWNLPHREKSTRAIAISAALLLTAAGLFWAKPPATGIAWEPWSEKRAADLLEEGTPVYIDFTAKWCATCQVNKKRAYPKEVIALMKQKGVVALRGDKTKPDPEIDAALQKLGRTAIPVNVLLSPGKEPMILPELLSAEDVSSALRTLTP